MNSGFIPAAGVGPPRPNGSAPNS